MVFFASWDGKVAVGMVGMGGKSFIMNYWIFMYLWGEQCLLRNWFRRRMQSFASLLHFPSLFMTKFIWLKHKTHETSTHSSPFLSINREGERTRKEKEGREGKEVVRYSGSKRNWKSEGERVREEEREGGGGKEKEKWMGAEEKIVICLLLLTPMYNNDKKGAKTVSIETLIVYIW